MPDGFRGNAPVQYLTEAEVAHKGAVDEKGRITASAPSRRPPRQVMQRLPYGPHDARSGGNATGIGNSSNIVADNGEYAALARDISQVDNAMSECLNSVALEIEGMCETIYILPETVPRCTSHADVVKSALNEFRSLTGETLTIACAFAWDATAIR